MSDETFVQRLSRQSDDAAEAKFGTRPNGTAPDGDPVTEPNPDPEGPAIIRKMRPSPETNRRYWEVWCPVCTTEEGMFAEDDPRLAESRNQHNNLYHSKPDPEVARLSDAFLVDLYWRTTGDNWAMPDELIVKFGRALLAAASTVP